MSVKQPSPSDFDATAYGPVVAALLPDTDSMPLNAGKPNPAMHAQLQALSVEDIFAPAAIRDGDMARCCLSGLWLYHNYLGESHKISQEIETISGSYWHGIMHRRENDFSNAKYWFHRVGAHPIFPALARAASTVAGFHAGWAKWDSAAFVDYCARALQSEPALEAPCRQLQEREWELLFDYCYARAIGRTDA